MELAVEIIIISSGVIKVDYHINYVAKDQGGGDDYDASNKKRILKNAFTMIRD